MSYICNDCGKTEKLISTKKGEIYSQCKKCKLKTDAK